MHKHNHITISHARHANQGIHPSATRWSQQRGTNNCGGLGSGDQPQQLSLNHKDSDKYSTAYRNEGVRKPYLRTRRVLRLPRI